MTEHANTQGDLGRRIAFVEMSAAGHDVNAMMQVRNGSRSVPNVRACNL